ncbi:hypothetical protein ACIRQY_23990 [Streptomyces sp. NPDC101490]|uniref:hypothetical protein n=1 Tax=Streptomyces sp. NPDC101490 TaxID=3366143 RepID=UPI00380085E9
MTIALALLCWNGKVVAPGIVGGVLLLWFSGVLAWAYADGDHGRHALQRASNVAFGWGDGF